ncbi:hypothetical protein AMC90_CH01425 [Rhizobium phaseoli]|uniref:hypothetical protein n=1 Tax=Rhizobium phaseoli TaxID=396 RepID=UPI0002EC7CEE|nr:hypothetical protein [Rhizobium phaseoli]ANL27284.1 hypothetical protein AMC90_CH01425 [Rhizobium phaseoli]ANL33550.1 hypothetical protein AMC89_CH01459 [Rhizobium phaseoli]ANL71471.1 hypothetical protein AMC83_CH01459 [Rhizobium phaseoli]ANL97277.1 hypothetical protein AMC79_CH01455 [Rhizobium phaseoli]ANM03570.1 hypothetical protein AMC78_CH01441 [Rhizobium phaseoli]
MIEKEIWTAEDFDAMGWHDCRLYSVSLPNENFEFRIDIDYIFKWERQGDLFTGFWVSECDLTFHHVSDFKIAIEPENTIPTIISDIMRENARPTHSGELSLWDYEIRLDKGVISFSATGFTQKLRSQPVFSDTQDLNSR